jgi:hypothetical protein
MSDRYRADWIIIQTRDRYDWCGIKISKRLWVGARQIGFVVNCATSTVLNTPQTGEHALSQMRRSVSGCAPKAPTPYPNKVLKTAIPNVPNCCGLSQSGST